MKARDVRREADVTVLARRLPPPSERDLPASRRTVLKEHLMQEFTPAGNAGPQVVAPQRPRRRPRPAVLTAAVAAVAIGAGVTALALSRPGPRAGGLSAAGAARTPAARLLDKVAATASRQPSPDVRDSEYEYVKSLEQYQVFTTRNGKTTVRMPKPFIRQFWMSVSDLCQPILIYEGGSYVHVPGQQGRAKCPDEGTLQQATYRLLQSLPASPGTVLQQIYAADRGLLAGPHPYAPGQSRYSYAFDTIGDILNDQIVPPQASATLYRAAALIPGVTLLPDAVNAAGQHGVAVSIVYSGEREEWIFDKSTLLYIGQRDVDVKTGQLDGSNAILARGFASRAGQVPAAGG